MRYSLPALPALLLATLLLSCGDSTDPPAGGGAIMPLAVGNSWTLRGTTYDSTGAPVAVVNDTLRLVSTSQDAGATWYRDDESGWYRLDPALGLLGTYNYLMAKYPARTGDTFSTETALVLIDDTTGPVVATLGWQVLSTDTSITVPAGTFRCHHYSYGLLNHPTLATVRSLSNFYAPGVGLVLYEQRDGTPPSGRVIYRRELVSYHLF